MWYPKGPRSLNHNHIIHFEDMQVYHWTRRAIAYADIVNPEKKLFTDNGL